MKNNKGIALITLLITVIVIIIISSISVYNGVNLVKDTRKKDAEDRLRTICSAIFKDDTFLDFNVDNMHELTEDDFDYMDLLKYYDEDYSVTVRKIESGDENKKTITYELAMQEKGSSIKYEYSADYTLSAEKYNYTVNYDEANGMNRPIVVSGMTALMPDGTAVEDLYKDNWYNYKKGNSNFAKVKTEDDRIFIWIPRFAYNIQTFYNGRESKEVPSTAISIVFLRGTSNYMINDEVMPETYKVHPAFTKGDIEYSGIWVEEKEFSELATLHAIFESREEYDIHMMTNNEFGAALYLIYALEDMDEISFAKDEYVAASTSGGIGKFSSSNDFVTEYELDDAGKAKVDEKYGDAFHETPWNRVLADYPTVDKPYVIRKFSSGIFDFTNSTGMDTASYRGVITVK